MTDEADDAHALALFLSLLVDLEGDHVVQAGMTVVRDVERDAHQHHLMTLHVDRGKCVVLLCRENVMNLS